ncbi:MAG: hypothetical protein HKO92_07105 [Flavobacteriaceae bacterium]|nr:hypothetical protein [Flavobacteriaceae bacterium]
MKSRITKVVLLISLLVFVFNCKDNKYTPVQKQQTQQSHHDTHEVIAKEFHDVGGYTYVKVLEDYKEYWIAIPKTKIEVDKAYAFVGGAKMKNFESKELNKTFDEILFVEGLYTKGEKKDANKNEQKHELIAQPEGGTQVSVILKDPESFKEKTITVKGKVVKVNNGILDRNWVHITDGTSHNNKFNLTFTTQEKVNVGDIITFKGVVALDEDFGFGYVYPILVEQAALVN